MQTKLSDSITSTWGRIADKAFFLFYGYCFLVTLGAFVRFSHGVSTVGITSILLIGVIVLRMKGVFKVGWQQPILKAWLILIVYITILTLFEYGTTSSSIWSYRKLGSIFIYILFAGAVASIRWTEKQVYIVGYLMALGLLLCAILSLVDGMGIMNIARVNDSPVLHGDLSTFYPYGQFRHRSVMGLYLAVILTFLLVLSEGKGFHPAFRIITFITVLFFLTLLIYSRNGSGPGAILIAFTVYFIFNLYSERKSFIKYIPNGFLVYLLAIMIVAAINPHILKYYYYRWLSTPVIKEIADPYYSNNQNDYSYIIEVTNQSDTARINLLRESFSQLKTAPFGKSFKDNAHVFFIVDVIFATGVLGLIWIVLVSILLLKMLKELLATNINKTIIWALTASLMAWVLVGIMYNGLNIGIAWGFFGVLISLHRRVTQKNYYGALNHSDVNALN